MKIRIFSIIVVVAALLCGCSSTTSFRVYPGSEIFQGNGGEMRKIDGIDFWVNGDSDRKYKILGVIDENDKRRHPWGHLSRVFSSSGSGGVKDSAIAEAAHKQGGDAVFVVSINQQSTDTGDYGAGNHRQLTKFVVIKYVK